MIIDTSFDFRTDAKGKDVDSHSPTLKKYHQNLWSKPLPMGGELILDNKLENHSSVGEFRFASDSIIHAFEYWESYQNIIDQIPADDIKHFVDKSYTIAGMLIFPANKVDNKKTINGCRGTNKQIQDRIDLTMECIRLYYEGKTSPLYECLSRYRSFFNLFGDFKGYTEFFLLQDLVEERTNRIRFFLPFERFGVNILPENKEEYIRYMNNCLEFVDKRSRRIAMWGNTDKGK